MTPSPADRRARGIAVRRARMARVAGIRRRVVASSLALFVATWLLITLMLATGHDPALAPNKAVAAATTAPAAATTTPAATTRTSGPTTTSTTSSTPATSPSALTSRQS